MATTTPALGAGLADWLHEAEPGWQVADIVLDRVALERQLASPADLVVASACLDGVLVVASTARAHRQVPLLVLATDPDVQLEADLLRAGAMAVVCVRTAREELLRVAASLMEGRSVASAAAMRILTEGSAQPPRFTNRQREILLALARGRSTRQIAADLVLTPSTMKTHIDRLAARLGMSGRQELKADIVAGLGAEVATPLTRGA